MFMKKIISILLALVFLTCTATCSVGAIGVESLDAITTTTTQYLEDGSYIVTTLTQSASPRATTYTKAGYKTVNFYNSDDELQWKYTLIGTFNVVEGSSATCIGSTYTYEIVDDSWHLTDHNNRYTMNIAYGEATFKKKVLFIVTKTENINASMGCDRNGNIN